MPYHNLRSGRIGGPPFVKPFLHALNRMQERETLRADQLTERARALLEDRFGPADGPVETGFAYGGTGLLSEHTHYFDGFAVLMPLPYGTAVAVRPASGATSRLVVEGSPAIEAFDRTTPAGLRDDRPAWLCLIEAVVHAAGGPEAGQVDVSLVSTVPWSCTDAYLAALSVSVDRALRPPAGHRSRAASGPAHLQRCIVECLGRPFSRAYLIAAEAGTPEAFLLVDTATDEQLALPAPAQEAVGYGLVEVPAPASQEAAFYQARQAQADEALALLQRKGFAALASFRELEHRDLQRALDFLPRELRPVVRFLVSENRRVQKLVAAVRRTDWQMFGALLLMSHAAQRTDWGSTSEAADYVVEEVERLSIEGMYGAAMTGQGGAVLLIGQPFSVPNVLDRLQTSFETRFDHPLETLLL